jgi:hypothetical protein
LKNIKPDEASPADLSRRIGPVVGRIVPVRLKIKTSKKFFPILNKTMFT